MSVAMQLLHSTNGYRTRLKRTGEPYELEYIVFAHGKDGLLTEVFESLDSLGSANLFAGMPVDKNPYRG
jgi:ketosteroid isomerase-like protein